ncbi:MAG: phenylalanine--tRNA ligase subunit beta [Bacilli bacterium]
MKISTNWINDFVDIKDENLKELAEKITRAGVNVETVSGGIDTTYLCVGEIIESHDHPSSDHLHICKVDVGKEVLQIVCGAPNVRDNLKVIVSLVGASLPNGVTIKKGMFRGVESNGMLCALSELGMTDLIEGGIHELPEDSIIGSDPLKYINVDTIYTLDLNPNRNDCLSHIGFAYEVASVLGKKVTLPDNKYKETNKSIKDEISLSVETPSCSLYLAKKALNVTIKQSPEFIKERLISCGIRSINNVVDISNYIMLEYGQPLHFFDADKVGSSVLVRNAYDEETTITLDNKKRELNSEDTVITNGKEVIAIAGVMGCLNSDISDNTKNILIESAIFDNLKNRNTSIRLDLRSEASLRYEKGLNYEYTYDAINRACYLLEKYADASIEKDMLEYDKQDKTPKTASVNLEKINKVLGSNLSLEKVNDIFNNLGFSFTTKNDNYTVTIPFRRMDVSIKEDLIEEVGRILGYDYIKETKVKALLSPGSYNPNTLYKKEISKYLRSLGFNEIRTYSLILKDIENKYNYEGREVIELLKPISSDRDVFRTSLIPSSIATLNFNYYRKVENIFTYEIANTYYKENEKYIEDAKVCITAFNEYITSNISSIHVKADFYLLKGLVQNLLEFLGFKNRIRFNKEENLSFMHSGMCASIIIDNESVGFIGRINPIEEEKEIYVCELSITKLISKKTGKIKYVEPSKYPNIEKDLAFVLPNNVVVGDVLKEITSCGTNTLKNTSVFDVYDMKDGNKSVAFHLIFEDKTKTLTEEEVNNITLKIISKIEGKFNSKLRN